MPPRTPTLYSDWIDYLSKYWNNRSQIWGLGGGRWGGGGTLTFTLDIVCMCNSIVLFKESHLKPLTLKALEMVPHPSDCFICRLGSWSVFLHKTEIILLMEAETLKHNMCCIWVAICLFIFYFFAWAASQMSVSVHVKCVITYGPINYHKVSVLQWVIWP